MTSQDLRVRDEKNLRLIYDPNHSLREVWDSSLELRLAQEEVIDSNYPYYVGWKPIEEVR